jgi:hypothetical protein
LIESYYSSLVRIGVGWVNVEPLHELILKLRDVCQMYGVANLIFFGPIISTFAPRCRKPQMTHLRPQAVRLRPIVYGSWRLPRSTFNTISCPLSTYANSRPNLRAYFASQSRLFLFQNKRPGARSISCFRALDPLARTTGHEREAVFQQDWLIREA